MKRVLAWVFVLGFGYVAYGAYQSYSSPWDVKAIAGKVKPSSPVLNELPAFRMPDCKKDCL